MFTLILSFRFAHSEYLLYLCNRFFRKAPFNGFLLFEIYPFWGPQKQLPNWFWGEPRHASPLCRPAASDETALPKARESVAQQVEHIPFKDGVLGSSPSWFTSSEQSLLFLFLMSSDLFISFILLIAEFLL